jgi:hypothetical protein
MKQAAKFGFITGLLAGTAAVGLVGLMLGATDPAHTAAGPTENLVATQSTDGSVIYLWRVGPDGSMQLLTSTPAPATPGPAHAAGDERRP